MCNLSLTPHSNLEKDNSLNHSCVSPNMGCLEYTNYELRTLFGLKNEGKNVTDNNTIYYHLFILFNFYMPNTIESALSFIINLATGVYRCTC